MLRAILGFSFFLMLHLGSAIARPTLSRLANHNFDRKPTWKRGPLERPTSK